MSVYLATVDNYFLQGMILSCERVGIDVIPIALRDIKKLTQRHSLHDGDTLILALDEFKGDFLTFLSYIPILRSLHIKIVMVSDTSYHLRHVGGYMLSKVNPFSDYLEIIRCRSVRDINFIRHNCLNERDYLILHALYKGVSIHEVANILARGNLKIVSYYKYQALRKLGVKYFNDLYKIF